MPHRFTPNRKSCAFGTGLKREVWSDGTKKATYPDHSGLAYASFTIVH
jgi:hypothetical protein